MQAGPCGQIRPNLPNRGIEPDSSREWRPVLGGDRESPLMPHDQVQKAAVRDLHCFRKARRPRGIDQIREIARLDDNVRRLGRISSDRLSIAVQSDDFPWTAIQDSQLARICYEE